jgi:hypothetical protein
VVWQHESSFWFLIDTITGFAPEVLKNVAVVLGVWE